MDNSKLKRAPVKKTKVVKPVKEHPMMEDGPDGTRVMRCKLCNEAFKSAQSLGGHISRKHPKTSDQYQSKMKRRDERAFDRKLL